MNGYWCYFLKKLSPEYCKDILDRSKAYDFFPGVIGSSELDTTVRRSNIKFIQSSDTRFKDVFDLLWLMAIDANKNFFNFHISKLDFIQIAEYDHINQGEYKRHHDVFWLNNDPVYHRKISCSIQLSDGASYTGGDLLLEDLHAEEPSAADIREQGTALFFPSFVLHKVNPVITGKRYSLVAWFDGPKWR